jgi:cellulose synthase/poly-beta-1,6-N-acetylglucosamine synthase-like glycosyltransferase
MRWDTAVFVIQTFFLVYFLGLHAGYLTLMLSSFVCIVRSMPRRVLDYLPQPYAGFEPPISILVPAHNEQMSIAASVRSLLQLGYSDLEIVVINDGSADKTLEVLIEEFDLYQFPESFDPFLETNALRAIYHSRSHPNLRVIDKERGGKADALNAGINCARFPIVCSVDADSMLQRDSLKLAVQPFMEDSTTVASGGTVRVANGCEMIGGFLVKVGLPRNYIARIQVVEYLRAFLFGRMGWSPLNAVPIISGAFGLFLKQSVVAVGGYRKDTIGEDMDLVVRLHRYHRLKGLPYRIGFVPDPICWTEAPVDLKTLRNQRVRWQRGLCESIAQSPDLLFNPKAGPVGVLALPFLTLFELIGPLVEMVGYLFLAAGLVLGLVSIQYLVAFLAVAIGLGIFLSACSLLLEELAFHIYPRYGHMLRLLLATVLENIGYRQMTLYWRLVGLLHWLFRRAKSWGEMKRSIAHEYPSGQTKAVEVTSVG